MPNTIAIVILSVLILHQAIHFLADTLNLRSMDDELPEAFHGWYEQWSYRLSQAYLRANTRFEWVVQITGLTVFVAFWFAHGFSLLDQWVRGAAESPVVRGLLFIALLAAAKAVLDMPFSIYRTFVIEERFGFNRTDRKTFILDRVKGLGLGVIIGGPLLSLIIWFFAFSGENAWWYCWIAVIFFMLVMQFVFPSWILPLFNRLTPLEPGELRTAILSYADSIGFPLKNIFVMDGSRRSSKSNAFFAGFGRSRRIVLFDTLIRNHDTPELLTILAHEMGHYKKRHIRYMILAAMAEAGLMLYLLQFFISAEALFTAFFLDQVSVYAGLVFFGVLYAPVEFFLGLLMKRLSRRNEYAADRFAVHTTRQPKAFARALKRISVNNLSNLRPHPLYVALNYTHPPVLSRIHAIEDSR
jgi:STE24 endopeptidase